MSSRGGMGRSDGSGVSRTDSHCCKLAGVVSGVSRTDSQDVSCKVGDRNGACNPGVALSDGQFSSSGCGATVATVLSPAVTNVLGLTVATVLGPSTLVLLSPAEELRRPAIEAVLFIPYSSLSYKRPGMTTVVAASVPLLSVPRSIKS